MNKSALASARMPDARIARFRSNSIDEYNRYLSENYGCVQAQQIDSEYFNLTSSKFLLIDGLYLSRIDSQSGVRLYFGMLTDCFSFSMPSKGTYTVLQSKERKLESHRNSGLIIDMQKAGSATIGPDTALPQLLISSRTIHNKLYHLTEKELSKRIEFHPNISPDSPVASIASTLFKLLSHEHDDFSSVKYPLAFTNIQEALLSLIIEGIPHNHASLIGKRPALPSPGFIKRAIEFIEENAHKPLRLSDISLAAGVNERSLQSGFMKFKEISPMAHLRSIRLSKARTNIVEAESNQNLTEIAKKWGFTDLAAFSNLYLKAYGERPSTTMKYRGGTIPKSDRS